MASLTKTYSTEKLQGKIYTPAFIIEKILDDAGYTGKNILGKSILDPACGDGRFLVEMARRIIKVSPLPELKSHLQKIHGWDIDPLAVQQARKKLDSLVEPLGIRVDWSLKVQNALHQTAEPDLFNPEAESGKFDFIVGNPPYIRIQHLPLNERRYIQRHFRFCQSGSTDIFIAFFELALRLAKDHGTIGFITPNTYFYTETARPLRRYLVQHKHIRQITNYHHFQLFSDATTYSAITILRKTGSETFLYQYALSTNKFQEQRIPFDDLRHKKFWSLGLENNENRHGKRLGDIARIHVGITTLADKLYIMPWVRREGDLIYLKTKHHGILPFEKDILRPIIKASTLKKTGEPVKEYVLFPYRKINGKHRIIPEHELKEQFPLAYQYLTTIKPLLDKRDNGKPNKVAWYAFGRSQGLDTSFGKKILFAPLNKKPHFILCQNEEATFYSGYCIKYDGDYEKLLRQLNSERMEDYIRVSSRDFRGGWKAYNKKIVQEFIIYDE